MDSDKKLELLAEHYRETLHLLGEDPSREGLLKTPSRVAKAMTYLTSGYEEDPIEILHSALFDEASEQMVLVKDIPFYSMCEHHLLPFFGKAHIAYYPSGRITGLSKLPRVVDAFSRRLQVQERLTRQILEAVDTALAPRGVIVMLTAQHMCMQMRGVEKDGSETMTLEYSGCFGDASLRQEFLSMVRRP